MHDARLSLLRGITAALEIPEHQIRVRSALAFQLSWLLLAVFSKQARDPDRVERQVELIAADLGLRLPAQWMAHLSGEPTAAEFRTLMSDLRAQLAACDAREVPYLDAGCDLMMGAACGELDKVNAGIAGLGLPDALGMPRADAAVWLNEIHSFFNKVLRGSRNEVQPG